MDDSGSWKMDCELTHVDFSDYDALVIECFGECGLEHVARVGRAFVLKKLKAERDSTELIGIFKVPTEILEHQ